MAPVSFGPRKKSLPLIWSVLPGKRVMVAAPHMDDEVIGCGGTLLMYSLSGRQTFVTYFTSGKRNTSLRKKEAIAAQKELGIGDAFYLEAFKPDAVSEVITALASIYKDLQYDVLFVPNISDWHPEHQWVNTLWGDFFKGQGKLDVQIFGYEVWSHPFPDYLCDISSVFERKARALSCYESQLRLFRYQELIKGTGMMRAAFFRRHVTHAEAFQWYQGPANFVSLTYNSVPPLNRESAAAGNDGKQGRKR